MADGSKRRKNRGIAAVSLQSRQYLRCIGLHCFALAILSRNTNEMLGQIGKQTFPGPVRNCIYRQKTLTIVGVY
jgi:hypothetical protein